MFLFQEKEKTNKQESNLAFFLVLISILVLWKGLVPLDDSVSPFSGIREIFHLKYFYLNNVHSSFK